MEKELAKHIALTAWKSFGDLTRVIPLLQDHCHKTERDIYVKAIAAVGASIQSEILMRVFSEHPELEKDMDAKIERYEKWI